MENRWSDRRGLELGVEVYQAGDKLMTCRSKDIGLGGTYLMVSSDDVDVEDHQFALDADSDVELVFHINDGSLDTKYYLHAKVIRVSENGIGLKFHDFDTSVFRSLQELLNYKGKQQATSH